ncbi:protease inhibitor I42 family protein [Nitrosovibrio tenuis]|uniref:Predicted secreted protein n=1 Tax=Nitrosovibrio tenuis TaxID=1233 RepID=A0A1H7NNH3_9PROT|nr:protease inhibitor I42 family protein [Nitrosovibrio tenuis]SEL24884.1 Predicted secreted protein [Nitrosovibrio tenuis]
MEASSELVLHPGAEYRVVLGGLGSAGYVWEFQINGPPGVIAIRPVLPVLPESPPKAPDAPDAAHPSALQTTSVEHTFIIDALEPGEAEALFFLRRPWQKDVPPVRTVTVRVTVAI